MSVIRFTKKTVGMIYQKKTLQNVDWPHGYGKNWLLRPAWKVGQIFGTPFRGSGGIFHSWPYIAFGGLFFRLSVRVPVSGHVFDQREFGGWPSVWK